MYILLIANKCGTQTLQKTIEKKLARTGFIGLVLFEKRKIIRNFEQGLKEMKEGRV